MEKRDKTCLVGRAWWHMPRLLIFQARSIGDIFGFYSLRFFFICLLFFFSEIVALFIIHVMVTVFHSLLQSTQFTELVPWRAQLLAPKIS